MELKYSIFMNLPVFIGVVDLLAKEVKNPSFMPHVTLAGHIQQPKEQAILSTRQIAAALATVELNFEGFDTQNREFRYFCLMIKPSNELARVYEVVHQFIPEVTQESFKAWPHVSLLYGTKAATERYPLITPLKERFGTSLNVVQSVKHISLWDTSGDVDTWKEIKSFELTGG